MSVHLSTRVETFGMYGHSYGCKHCGFRGYAQVVVTGAGEATGHGEGSAAVARASAKHDADRLVERSLLFALCPECGKTDPASGPYRAKRIALSIAIGLAFLTVAIAMALRLGSPVAPVALLAVGGFGVASAIKAFLRLRRPWARAAQRVSFDGYPAE